MEELGEETSGIGRNRGQKIIEENVTETNKNKMVKHQSFYDWYPWCMWLIEAERGDKCEWWNCPLAEKEWIFSFNKENDTTQANSSNLSLTYIYI